MKLKQQRQFLNISVNELANYLQVSSRTIRRWERGDLPTPHAVTLLLQFVIQYGFEPTTKIK